jgi:hypothetical protein
VLCGGGLRRYGLRAFVLESTLSVCSIVKIVKEVVLVWGVLAGMGICIAGSVRVAGQRYFVFADSTDITTDEASIARSRVLWNICHWQATKSSAASQVERTDQQMKLQSHLESRFSSSQFRPLGKVNVTYSNFKQNHWFWTLVLIP